MSVKCLPNVIAMLLGFAVLTPGSAHGQTADDLFDASQLHEIRLFINSRDLALLHARYEDNTYYPADLLWRNVRVRNVAIRSRGYGSRNPIKIGLAVDMDRYTTGQRFLGLSSLVLDNLWQDPAMIREYLAMGFFRRMGQPAPRTSFGRLYVNNVYQGVYGIVEVIDASFVSRALGESGGTLFEYHWQYPFFGGDLGDDLEAYKPLFEPRTRELDPDAVLWGPIRDLWQAVNEPVDGVWRDEVGRFVDLEQFVTQAALEHYVAENDGLLGYAGMDNFYLYRRADSLRHRVFPWDKDTSFLQSDFALLQGIGANQLMRRAFEYADLRALYFDVLAAGALIDRSEAWLAQRVDAIAAVIAGAAYSDPRKPTSNDVFDAAVDTLRTFARVRSDYVIDELTRLTQTTGLNRSPRTYDRRR
jgi:spore coat protein CotH